MRTMRQRPEVGETARYPIDPGQRGINKEMIPRMAKIVREDHAHVRPYAVEIIRASGCGVRDTACHAKVIYDHVVERFFWISDPVLEETLIWPSAFVREMKKGKVFADCASVNMALTALLGAIGIRASFVFGSDGKRQGGEPVVYHVWTTVPIRGEAFYLEPTTYMPAGRARRFKEMFVVDPWAE